MAGVRRSIDVSDIPALKNLIAEARATNRPRLLRAGDEDLALLIPLHTRVQRHRVKSEADLRALRSAFGAWKGLIDPEELKSSIREARGSDRPPVEL